MKCSTTRFDDVLIIEPKVNSDNRGYFIECYVKCEYEKLGVTADFVQDNHSHSASRGTVRGMHFQLNPKAQAKLIHAARGEIINVVVDIRKGSPTFGKWITVELSSENKKQLFVPKGFANGYCTLTNNAEITYKVDEYYDPQADRCFRWDDPDIGIEWPITNPILSERDKNAPPMSEVENNFIYEGN